MLGSTIYAEHENRETIARIAVEDNADWLQWVQLQWVQLQ